MKKQKKHQNDILENRQPGLRNRETNMVSFLFVALFMLMAGYLIWFSAVQAPHIINNPYNKRIDNQEKKIVRGKILASDGSVLAETITGEDGTETRRYPYGSVFCHVVGLNASKSGIEGMENYELLSESGSILDQLANDASGQKVLGKNIVTTLVPKLQQAACDALGNNKGAVIVMEPATGKVLALVSKPDYDPNMAPSEYNTWLGYDSSDSVLLNRATQGLYPPGSTFKILTALAYIRQKSDYGSYAYTCSGSAYEAGGTTIPCYDNTAHGQEDLRAAFANSCNASFSSIGLELDREGLRQLCSEFLFNEHLNIGIESSVSSFSLDASSGISEVQETAIGQGKTMISPIHNLMIAAAVANGGIMMDPCFVERIENADGGVISVSEPHQRAELMTRDEAELLAGYMRAVVTDGTGSALSSADYRAAGKTGSAQYDDSENYHSWFVGFAPVDSPQIAVCVLVEDAGTASSETVPIAAEIFDAYLNR